MSVACSRGSDPGGGGAHASRMRNILLVSALVIGAFAVLPSGSSAQARRPLYFSVGAGPYAYFGCCDIHGRIEGEFGWHPSGQDQGFFLAANASLTIAGPQEYFAFFGGIRLGGDISVYDSRDIAVFLRPSGLFGAGFWDFDGPNNTYGFFVLQPAFDIKIAFGDQFFQLWFRPIGLDFYFWPEYVHDPRRGFDWSLGYMALGGIQLAF